MRDEEVLRAFREDPLPPSGVDVARAVRSGRRRHRLRTATAAGGLAVAVLAGGFAVPAWLTPGGSSPGQVGSTLEPTLEPTPPACPSPVASPVAAPTSAQPVREGTAPAQFDVLRRWIDVGTVPGLHVEQYTTARYWQQVTLLDADEHVQVEIQVFAGDGKPVFSEAPRTAPVPPDMSRATPADPVGGRAASWLPGHQYLYQYEVARLGWQWAEGGWAFVAVADTSREDGQPPAAERAAALRTTAHEVAEALRIGAGAQVTMPFTARMPDGDCMHLTGTVLHRGTHANGTPFTRSTLGFGRRDNTDPLLFPPDVTASVTADSVATPADKPGSATEQVDGHPAVVGDGLLVLHGMAGFALEVTAPMDAQRLKAYALSVQIVDGAHGDENEWTDYPLRK
jgi:hypothetical protein